MDKKKFKIAFPRFITFIGILLIIIGIIILISVKKTGKSDPGALTLPTEVVGEITPNPSVTPAPTATASATPVTTATPSPTLPPLPSSTPAPTPTSIPTISPTPGLKKDPKALSKPTKAMKKNAASGVLSGNNVNLRQGPSTTTPIVAQSLKRNDELTVYTLSGSFYFVKVNKLNKYGYISKSYVKLTSNFGESATPTPKTPVGSAPAGSSRGTISASKVALRSGPSTDSKCIAEYPSGTKVYVLSKEKDFYYVQIASSKKVGYVYAKYVRIDDK